MGSLFGKFHKGQSRTSSELARFENLKIIDSVYELAKPAEGQTPEIEIIFFHGLQLDQGEDAKYSWLTTWRSSEDDGKALCWPMTWLSAAFPNARVLSVSYDNAIAKTDSKGRMDMFVIAETVSGCLLMANAGKRENVPLLLVGHSIGGLVLKAVLLHMDRSLSHSYNKDRATFMNNVKGIFYFATPHGGSRVSAFLDSLSNPSPLTLFLKLFYTERGRLNEEFRNLRQRKQWKARSLMETADVNLSQVRYRGQVAEEGAQRQDSDEYLPVLDSNHFNICAPTGKADLRFRYLVSFISKEILQLSDERVDQIERQLDKESSSSLC